MVLGSALATAVCRQRQGRVALSMLTIEPERHTETPYRQEHTRYDIYDVVVAQVDSREHETHRNHQQGVEQSTLVPCCHDQDNDGYRRMTAGEGVPLNTFKGIQRGLERRGKPQASQGERVVHLKVKARSSGWSQEVEEIKNIIAQQQGTERHTEGQELTLPIQRCTQDKGQKVKRHIGELHVLGDPGHHETFEP